MTNENMLCGRELKFGDVEQIEALKNMRDQSLEDDLKLVLDLSAAGWKA